MSFAAKAVKKLGLGSAVTGLLAPFSGDRAALPDPEQARSYLERLRPDPHSSCLTARPEGFGRGTHGVHNATFLIKRRWEMEAAEKAKNETK